MKFVRTVTPFFKDSRGEMSHLLDGKVKIVSAVLITCKKGAIRANHYHEHDTHYSYMLKGSMEYVHKDLRKKNARKTSFVIKEGQLIVTPPMFAHAMRFLEDSVFLALTTEPRSRSEYEKDTKKIQLL